MEPSISSVDERSSDCKESAPFLTSHADDEPLPGFHTPSGKPSRRWYFVAFAIVCLTAVLSSWTTSLVMSARYRLDLPPEDNDLAADSPLRAIDRTYHTQWFEHWNFTPSAWNEHPSLGRVDDLWHRELGIGNHEFIVPREKGHEYGLDPRINVVMKGVENKYDGFPVQLDVVHQLHCLDALRRKLFMNRDWYMENWEVVSEPAMEFAHTSHCLDMIRQVLTCRSDVSLMPYRWVNTSGNQYPDFHRPHQCHNFKAARDWSAMHALPHPITHYLDKVDPPTDADFADPDFFRASTPSPATPGIE
ncbi:unnamed protein product [Zymoseptoria tritici ST99CH_1A5]|uniref:Tat pathway signal sequence n=1 Tax=Zymoseptoria tritici ST99CH_1A5 TaxID=1276529 RepID=A0A1Y6LSP9_ZYMTR|nr:unnamed protein product [Zymoseptoria tritici ST99CH_1A5]